ncbi:hypothetical protein, conserved [Plasmodium gonderi]|uniref:RAP domain-containing protein n=1 Tax=Plasmodium gonderi TaxID=77519 RepID=A0A1Y1JJB8_PLAGO|nr:hypothetical protein, conserved [Plasmodium gonderi]GAW81297.1 hypothetical protein, conserved [Plasmodium gonderi]
MKNTTEIIYERINFKIHKIGQNESKVLVNYKKCSNRDIIHIRHTHKPTNTMRMSVSRRTYSNRTIFNTFRRNLSNAKGYITNVEGKKIEKTIHYIEQCISEESIKNPNLLFFKTLHNQEDKLKYIHMNLIKMSYLLKNMQVSEQKWLTIYEKISNLCPLDEKQLTNKLKTLTGKYDTTSTKNISYNCALQNRICKEYNLLNLNACYVFVLKIVIDRLINYLPLYTISNYLLILNFCEKFFSFFFNLHNRKGLKKLNFIYIHSASNNYADNVKVLKNSNKLNRSGEKSNIAYQYKELYNLKYHQIVTHKINLMLQILENINYDQIEASQFSQLANFFYATTKGGIICEKNVQNFLSHYFKVAKKKKLKNEILLSRIASPHDVLILSQIINIMYYSKIIHSEVVLHLVNFYKNINPFSSIICKRNMFDNYLKLLTLVELTSQNLYLYNYCKYYVLNGNMQESTHMSQLCNFFFVSSIVGIFNISLFKFYINFLKKNNKTKFKASLTHKIYYTLLGWDIMINRFIKNLSKERRETLELVILKYDTKNVHYTYSDMVSNEFTYLSHQINYLTHCYKNKIVLEKERKNYNFNQCAILHILKKHYKNVIYEHITSQKILVDVFIELYKNNQCKHVAIEFNGRTHYNLVIKEQERAPNVMHYTMKESNNTKYKKWILTNLNFYTISIPYYQWNGLYESQKEEHLLHALCLL